MTRGDSTKFMSVEDWLSANTIPLVSGAVAFVSSFTIGHYRLNKVEKQMDEYMKNVSEKYVQKDVLNETIKRLDDTLTDIRGDVKKLLERGIR